MRALMLTAVAALALAGCSSSQEDDNAGSGEPSRPVQSSSGQASKDAAEASKEAPKEAGEVADALQKKVSTLEGRVEITEDNDSNNLIGRPGQYDQGVFLADSRLDCQGPTYNELDTACGVKIERWPDEAAAKRRGEDIQSKFAEYGLGTEYYYLAGRNLVRVSGDLKPSQAKVIEDAVAAL